MSIAIKIVVLVLPTLASCAYDVFNCMHHPVSSGKGISTSMSPGHVSTQSGVHFEVGDLLSLTFDNSSFRGHQGSHKTHHRFRDVFCEDAVSYRPWWSVGWLFVFLNVGGPLLIVAVSCYKTIMAALSEEGRLSTTQKRMFSAVWSKFRASCTEFSLINSLKNALFPLLTVVSLSATSPLVLEWKFSDGFFQAVCGAAFLIVYVVCVHKWQPYPQMFSNRMELMLCWSQIVILIVMGFSFSVPEIKWLPAGFVDERMVILFLVQFFALVAPIVCVLVEVRREVRAKLRRGGRKSATEDEIDDGGDGNQSSPPGGGAPIGWSMGASKSAVSLNDQKSSTISTSLSNADAVGARGSDVGDASPPDLVTRRGSRHRAQSFANLDRVEQLRQKVLLYGELIGVKDLGVYRTMVERMSVWEWADSKITR